MFIRTHAPCSLTGKVITKNDLPCSNEGCGNKAHKAFISTHFVSISTENNKAVTLKAWFALCDKCGKKLINENLTVNIST